MNLDPRATADFYCRRAGVGRSRPMAALPAHQRGVALVVALILLGIMTLGGLAAISTTLVQNRAAANQYDRQTAFQSAEGALRVAQERIRNGSAIPTEVARNCDVANGGVTCAANPFDDATLPAGAIIDVTSGRGGDEKYDAAAIATGQPQYVIENMGAWADPNATGSNSAGSNQYGSTPPPDAIYYRVTARSGDITDADIRGRSVVTLQAVIRQN